MRRFFYIALTSFILIFAGSRDLKAQVVLPEGYELADSVVYIQADLVDKELADKNIFQVLGPSVRISQTQAVRNAMDEHFEKNKSRQINGYRVRIFFDNKQNARVESENALKAFLSRFHDVAAYRSYANPYFKVTVGDFRTRSEAMQLLQRIQGEFPTAFIVRESICYPPVDKEKAFLTDTLKVARKNK